MSVIVNNLNEIVDPNKNQIVILQPTAINENSTRPFNNSPVARYVISMFRIDNNNSIRPRKINRSPWTESYNGNVSDQHSIFRIGDHRQKTEVPVSLSLEHTSDHATLKNVGKAIYENLDQYFVNSSLHGLKYVGDTSLSFGERLFWLSAFITAVCFATYFIITIYAKYNLNPVIMSLNPKPTPVSSLPFPAVTICNMNQVKRSEAERIMTLGTDAERVLLDDYCNTNTSNVNITAVGDEATRWDNVQKFILRVNPSCREVLKVCLWKQNEMDCNDIFNNALTDEGLCCTFNALPREYIFRNPKEMGDLNITFPSAVDDWNPEDGYSANATLDTIPWRGLGRGTHLGLSVVLDAEVRSYFCSSTSSVGFKILLHNPIETPKMADFGFLIPPGMETRIIISPKISVASETVRDIEVSKRMCFFSNERNLLFYRTYTERNCKLECQANYTLQLCGCVPFYLPKSKQKKICGKKQETCSNAAKDAMDTVNPNATNCNCLPGCFELGYDSTSSYAKLTDLFKIKENIIKNETMDYFVENMAVVHFYFMQSSFTGNTKSVIYGFSEFLSNTGGLLGLFLGFSFLSAVEIGYYLSLRILCTVIRTRNKKSSQKSKGQQMNTHQGLIYPFAK